ncbi:MAG: aminotransferase class I/II-fold pyridoxal phosphate-dependent enzyme [Proteocatella sp.]
MYSFKDDYSEGAHPKILEALASTNLVQEDGYGMDSHCKRAIKLLKEATEDDSIDVHFISGGTQTNLLAISSCLRPHEACISAKTGHIATHETGAIEASGHKVITIENSQGKLFPDSIQPILKQYNYEYSVKPKVVYISNPTELGTVYTKDELKSLYKYCQLNGLLLYLDGARLSSALVVPEAQLSFKEINKYTDAFFFGGTKNGALLGEALILSNDAFKSEFRYMMKQKGAMLAKGRILGIQFETLLKDELYLDLAKKARNLAQYSQSKLKDIGFAFLIESATNQIFPIISNCMIESLREDFDFHTWSSMDEENSCIRLVFSWATPIEKVDAFLNRINQLNEKL